MKNPAQAHALRSAPLFSHPLLLGSLLALAISVPTYALSPQPVVNLRSAGTFAVLAASLISNVPTSAVTGDIGLSPATGGNITGFGPSEVTGTIYAVDASGPAGSVPAASMLTTAKGDLTLAYNDAAGRMPVPVDSFLNPGAGNMGGRTLPAGLYKFTGAAAITGSDLTLSGSATDVWIFQIGSGLTVANGIKVILAGGALPQNIFWQVGTSAMIGTTCAFKGTILADQSISLNTGASLNGRALARVAAVTLASNAITRPPVAATALAGSPAPQTASFRNDPNQNLEFTVPSSGQATLKLFDTAGRPIATLFNGRAETGKPNRVNFETKNLARGLYFAQLDFAGATQTDKLLLGR